MEYVLVFITLFVLELGYFRIADKCNIIDKPNERSSHTQITLRGGGVVFYLSALSFFITHGFVYPFFLLGLTTITLISFLDDIYTLSSKVRLVIHLLSMVLMYYEWSLFNYPIFWFFPVLVLIIGIVNAYNFMDGINGITALYSIIVLILLAYLNINIQFVDMSFILYVILGLFVFSFFNFRSKAKAFAGDVGSVSIAFIIIFLLGLLMIKTGNYIYILFLSIYGIDSLWTIILRGLRGENIFQAHRTHLYQYLANEVKINKLVVSFIYGMLQMFIGILTIYFSEKDLILQIIFACLSLLTLSVGYLLIKRFVVRKYVNPLHAKNQ